MFGRVSTRELALRAAARIESHEETCAKRYKESADASDRVRDVLDRLKTDLDARYEQNTDAINKLQTKLLIGAVLVLLSIVLKGNPLDILKLLFVGAAP